MAAIAVLRMTYSRVVTMAPMMAASSGRCLEHVQVCSAGGVASSGPACDSEHVQILVREAGGAPARGAGWGAGWGCRQAAGWGVGRVRTGLRAGRRPGLALAG